MLCVSLCFYVWWIFDLDKKTMKNIFSLLIAFLAIYLGLSIAIIVGGIVLEAPNINYRFIFEDTFKPSVFIFFVIIFFSYLFTPKK